MSEKGPIQSSSGFLDGLCGSNSGLLVILGLNPGERSHMIDNKQRIKPGLLKMWRVVCFFSFTNLSKKTNMILQHKKITRRKKR